MSEANSKQINPPSSHPASAALRAGLWITKALLALVFVGGGIWKFVTPLEEIAKIMPWTGEVEPGFFYTTATLDLLGGLGVIVPSFTRVPSKVATLALFGCLALMVCAIVFHLSRGEVRDTPFNFLLVGLCLFVIRGTRRTTQTSV